MAGVVVTHHDLSIYVWSIPGSVFRLGVAVTGQTFFLQSRARLLERDLLCQARGHRVKKQDMKGELYSVESAGGVMQALSRRQMWLA